MFKTMRQCLILCLPVLLAAVSTAESAQPCVPLNGSQVIVWHAGSLSAAFKTIETDFTCQTGIAVSDNSAGSLDIVRQVTAGGKAADIVAPADYLDIDLFLKPAGYAHWDIRFAEGKMVLAYCLGAGPVCGGASKQSASIAGAGTWGPPNSPTSDSIPNAVSTWYQLLTTSGVTIGGSYLYLDPSGYRAPMIFHLAQNFYQVANLYDNLLEHYFAIPATSASSANKLGAQYDYSLTYQHSAYANSLSDPNYRYVNLPDNINLGNSALNCSYQQAGIAQPGLFGNGFVSLPASRVIWGVTMLTNAPNPNNAVAFLNFLLGPDGEGALTADGPAPISPPVVTLRDYPNLPNSLKSRVHIDSGFEECL